MKKDDAATRVLGWDVLRGLSALAVAVYHLLLWEGVATLHTFGSYGVYLFFVLSGASLAYTYAEPFEQGRFSMAHFLWVRYMRLAPLYVTLMLVVLPWKMLQEGSTGTLLAKLALNASFLFGFYNPAVNSVLVGGWSLGIEALFYLLFPLILASVSHRLALATFALLVLAQVAWIFWVFQLPGAYAANLVFYHQVPAFAAYFMGGCLLGLARRRGHMPRLPSAAVLTSILGGFAVLFLLNPQEQGDELIGWRGGILFTLCFVLVWVSGGLRLQQRNVQRLATHLGDSTYGMYLMHPVVFFGLAFVVLPRLGLAPPQYWPVSSRLQLALAIVMGTFAIALLSEHYFERPLREWSKSKGKRYIDAARIS